MDTDEPQIDWADGRDLTGCSEKQTKLARGIVDGLSLSKAAKFAGYKGTDEQLRSVGSKMSRSPKVKALIAWARAGGAGPSDVPGDLHELRRILWKHARGADKNHSIKATEVLNRLAMSERDAGLALADDGLSDCRNARNFILTNENGAVAFVMLLSGQSLALSRLPMFHDLHEAVQRTWPEVWNRLLEKQSPVMKLDLQQRLADLDWQRGVREQIWGEIGWIVGSDGKAKPDPQGRAFIAPTTKLPGNSGANGHSLNGSDALADSAAQPADEAPQQAAVD